MVPTLFLKFKIDKFQQIKFIKKIQNKLLLILFQNSLVLFASSLVIDIVMYMVKVPAYSPCLNLIEMVIDIVLDKIGGWSDCFFKSILT
ncbi:hypothetical protein BpHYR1_033786 [Brachionus plicatilis]|uniref:Uncharacterized protein n=1 Tax=Brachionus plicatilis TaxID=10195 RepID=A0A3M7QUQ5_BRAPC|nr:hypothetical protein BpHYR1_033786 [Brachionus plicatilis]